MHWSDNEICCIQTENNELLTDSHNNPKGGVYDYLCVLKGPLSITRDPEESAHRTLPVSRG